MQLARLAGGASFFTALGDDDLGRRSRSRLAELGVAVHAAERSTADPPRLHLPRQQRGANDHDLGQRLQPRGSDHLPWAALAETDGVYFTAGDAAAARLARAARVLVGTPRAAGALDAVAADAIVFSANDDEERNAAAALTPQPALMVATEGSAGGSWRSCARGSRPLGAGAAAGPAVDQYGAGDCFAAGLTYALAAGRGIEEAIALAARCGAWCASGRGPFEGQLTQALSAAVQARGLQVGLQHAGFLRVTASWRPGNVLASSPT